MLEASSVLKTIILAFLVTLLLQTKFENRTFEDHINHWAKDSVLTEYTQQVASGAVVVLKGTAVQIKDFISEKMGGADSGSPQKASRLNFNFERSEKYQKSKSNEESDY